MRIEKLLLGSVPTHGLLTLGGITVHYAADRDVARTVASLVKGGLGYHYLINRNGTIFKLAEDSQMLYHAGNAAWRGKYPNRHHVAICLMSWGKLTIRDGKFFAWNGTELPVEEVRTRGDLTWDKATLAQEQALMDLLETYVKKGVDPEDICGHDECCIPKGRKIDPGGTLSLPVAEIRRLLMSLTS
jgi:N-acetyl-anhydromuramyl-L-alanine amidase AmpD